LFHLAGLTLRVKIQMRFQAVFTQQQWLDLVDVYFKRILRWKPPPTAKQTHKQDSASPKPRLPA
jgi:hypothetical protein